MAIIKIFAAAAATGVIALGASLHLTLVDSAPRDGAQLTEPPAEVLLKFNERPDTARRGISLRGPNGAVKMRPVRSVRDTLAFAATIEGALAPGQYTVSWLAAAPDHEPVRGRYRFTIEGMER